MRIQKSILTLLTFAVLPSSSTDPTWLQVEAENQEAGDERALPSWLIGDSFQLQEEVRLELDGSEESDRIERKREWNNEVIYKEPQTWRVRRELPDQRVAEMLKKEGEAFRINEEGERIRPPQSMQVTDDAWMNLMWFPVELAEAWEFIPEETTWSDWFDWIQRQSEETLEKEGNTIRIIRSDEDQQSQLDLVLEGDIFHDDTKAHIRSKWRLSYDQEITEEQLLR